MKKINLSRKLIKFGQHFTQAGFSCYLVGGAIRNIIAGLEPSDYDFTTDARPEEVQQIFKKVIPIGIQHGTVAVLFMGETYEVTTFRIEEGYSDSRHPDKVAFTQNIDEDLSRRDFTINAIAANLIDGKIIDPFNGRKDIQEKIIRCIGTPQERFNEDGLRILRLFRFHAKLKFKIHEETLLAAITLKKKLKKISAERIREEWIKILLSPTPGETFRLLQEKKILEEFLPELAHCAGIEQNQYHKWDVFEHSIRCMDAIPNTKLELRVAALLHDIGKPQTKIIRDGEATFYNHEKVSAEIAKSLLIRLKFSNKQIETICHLISQHMYYYTSDWSDKALRRFIKRVKIEYIYDVIELTKADRFAHKGIKGNFADLVELLTRIETILESGDALSLKELKIKGDDLTAIRIPKGPIIGIILEELLDTVLQDPAQNTKEELLLIAENLYKNRINIED